MASTAAESAIELRDANGDEPSSLWDREADSGHSLPPADHGSQAYLFLAACVMLEALVWGFPSIFGVFQDYYSTHEPFAGSENIAVIGTCAMGIMYMALPLAFAMLKVWPWPKLRRWSNAAGLVVMCVSLVLASFAQTVTQLIVTQGILFAVGGTFAWVPVLFYMPEWFSRKLSFAYGIMLGGLGLAGVILPVVVQWLLSTYGHQTTLRACSVVIFVLVTPFLYFFKPRLPESQASTSRRVDMSFWTTRLFLLSQLSNIIESLGYFLPALYLPTYARDLGAGTFTSTLTIILLNGAGSIGCVAMGVLVERYHFSTCMLISTVGTAAAVFCLWGFSNSLPMLYVFCIMYGLFATCWSTTWSGIMRDVVGRNESTDSGMVFASLSLGKGIGNVVSGPLSEALLKGAASMNGAALGYGSGYGTLIVFTGATAVGGACSFAAKKAGWV